MPRNFPLRISQRLGLPDVSRHRALAAALVVDAVGTGLSGPLLLLYLIRVIGLSAGHAGLLLTLSGLFSLTVPALVGQLVDRWGPRRMVIVAQGLQATAMVGFLLSPVVTAVEPVLAVSGLLSAVGQRAFWSSIFTVVSDVAQATESDVTDSWFALSGMMQAAGFAIGGLAAGGLLLLPGALPFQTALAVNATSFLVSACLLIVDPGHNVRRIVQRPTEFRSRRSLPDLTYLTLIMVNTLFAFCSSLLGIGLPVYVLNGLRAPAWIVGPLLAVNTILCATTQGLVVKRTQSWSKLVVLAVAGAVWAVWGVITAGVALIRGTRAPDAIIVLALLVSVLVYSVAEVLHAPRSLSVASDAAPRASRGQYLSWFQYSFAVATLAAPVGFGLAFTVRPFLPWLVAAGVAMLGSTGMILLRRPLQDRIARQDQTASVMPDGTDGLD